MLCISALKQCSTQALNAMVYSSAFNPVNFAC